MTQDITNSIKRLKTRKSNKEYSVEQVKKVGDFEAVVSFGLGLRRKTGFRVFRLSGPRRIVVDVAH